MNILGAHIDSPRIDLKQNPLYEDNGLAFFDTHYYGGIKHYQWVARPLSLHGVVCKKDGTNIDICIGEKEGDPVLEISDLLPHLARDQMAKTGNKVIEGEDLNALIGSIPAEGEEEKDPIKKNILDLLKKEYGIEEEDFYSAELELVPAGKARDLGLDKSMIMGYGHDDRICAYPSLIALLESKDPERTSVCILTDKEEIGSYSNSGATSNLYENFLMEVFAKAEGGIDYFNQLKFRKALAASKMLSTDVTTAYDPKYSSVFEKNNTAFMSHGLKIEKYTGARGKSGCSEANGDFIAEITDIFEKNSIPWQTGELGKIDAGGGGTIAAIMAKLGMDVVDMGVPVWSMHAPVEVISKIDLYYLYLGYKAFIENIG